jgi:hypothetical protein
MNEPIELAKIDIAALDRANARSGVGGDDAAFAISAHCVAHHKKRCR